MEIFIVTSHKMDDEGNTIESLWLNEQHALGECVRLGGEYDDHDVILEVEVWIAQ